MATTRAELTSYEHSLLAAARRGNWDAFTEHFLCLPFSGTWYTPEDRVDTYAILHKVWTAMGRPEDGALSFTIPDVGPKSYKVFMGNYKDEPAFLDPHGYRLLEWYKKLKRMNPDILVVVGATGSSKTSSIGADVLMELALEPGFDFINLAPTAKQSQDMLRDVTKWITGSRYQDFVVPSRSGNLWKDDLGVMIMNVDFGLGGYSSFRCMTIGERQGDFVLGDEADRINVDEAGLLYDIESYIERLITRIRGTRRTGMPRRAYPSLGFLTNPHDNTSMDRLADRAEEQMLAPTEEISYAFGAPTTKDNIYTTAAQLRLQRGLMSEAGAARWLEGNRRIFAGIGIIGKVLMETCYDKDMDNDLVVANRWGYPLIKRDGIGITHYQLPMIEDHEYIVAGDPGTQPLHRISDNNVPVVLVLDVTEFPRGPATMVAYRIWSGDGKWGPWLDQIVEWATYYKVTGGAYDATSAQSILSEFPLQDYPHILNVTFAGSQKRIAKTFFQLLAGRGFFRWPFLLRLWTEAQEYRETGTGVKRLPDDTIAALFAAAWYLRWRYYSELPEHLRTEKTEEEQEEAIDLMLWTMNRRSRYVRGATSRHRRDVDERPDRLPPPPD